jgi:spermidine synthase/MFS family permease
MSTLPAEVSSQSVSTRRVVECTKYEPALGYAAIWRLLVVAVTIVSNGALLVCQQVAMRLLAPLIGSSIETWSAVIGVFLLGICLGSIIASRLADRHSPNKLIVASLLLGALTIFLMQIVVATLSQSSFFMELPLEIQIGMATLAICLLPGIALSLVTAPSIRSLVHTASEAGSASGRIFAWGTFGSLLGNYLTGFVLLSLFGVSAIVQATWITLLVLAAVMWLVGQRALTGSAHDFQRNDESTTLKSETQISAAGYQATATAAWHVSALLIVVACSFVSGALEGAAFRILAPLVGVSMFLTAGVVGVVLTGMATGNALGGLIAQRYGTIDALKKSLMTAATVTLAIVILWTLALSVGCFDQLSIIAKVVAWSFLLFLLPALALGTITPQVIGLTVRDVRKTGAIAGQFYAYSTLGCIAGILVSSWFLMESLGAMRTSILCGLVPLLLILLLSRFELPSVRKQTWRTAATLFAFGVFLAIYHHSPFDRESKYFALRVTDKVIDDREVKQLALDSLVHSCIDLKDPNFLFYPHEQIQADLTRAAVSVAKSAGRIPRVLVIGGGGYTYPRWVEAQKDLADVKIDVVEIDPAVTEIAQEKLGLSKETRIVSIHRDGRQFVKSAPAESYDLVIQDAVNDLSVPYHLMTAEYNQLVQRLLRPNCLYLLTVIDNFDSGNFLASAVRTTEHVFGETTLLLPGKPAKDTRNVFVIAGRRSAGESKRADFLSEVEQQKVVEHYVYPRADIVSLLRRCGSTSPLLTDDYAPVDVLMSQQFLRRENASIE